MKTLHILRHGKATYDYGSIQDIDRPLIEKGIQNTYLIGSRFSTVLTKPDLIISSPAHRAIYTAIIFARTQNISMDKIKIEQILYNDPFQTILDFIKRVCPELNSLMVVGHNTGFIDLVNELILNKLEELPTSGLVSITFNCDKWTEIHKDISSAIIDYPKKKIANIN